MLPNLAGSAAPQPVGDPVTEAGHEAPEMGAMLARLVGGTVFVLALCVATLWGCRRWLGPAVAQDRNTGRFEVLESLPLGPRCRVQLIRVGEGHMLVGMDTAGVKVLLAVEGADEEISAPQPAGNDTPDSERNS